MKLIHILIATSLLPLACSGVGGETVKQDFVQLEPESDLVQIKPNKDASAVKDGLQHFTIRGKIDGAMSDQFIIDLSLTNNDAKAYVIDIDSPGGEVDSSRRMADAIQMLDKPTYCIVNGMGASMAFYLLQVCDVRMSTRSSRLLLHGPSIHMKDMTGNKNDYAEVSHELAQLERGIVEQYCTRMSLNEDEILTLMDGKDVWLDGDMALELGAIDVSPKDYKEALKMASNGWVPPPTPPNHHKKARHH